METNDVATFPRTLDEMDYSVEYSDEFYEDYINNFSKVTGNKTAYLIIKRVGDVFLSSVGLLVLWPVFLAIAVFIKLDSRGPVFFKQKRIGLHGKEFTCIKFRSMKIDAPKNAHTSLLENPEQYYTKVGRFLRKTSIDELPQLWCVLIGTMSIIGYRPLVPNEVKANNMRAQLGVFKMRPGISGLAQVKGRDEVYYKNKALLDAEYVKNASVLFDIKLVVQTVLVVLRREGNDAEKSEIGPY
jgi:O-antigen biosynthesis protein WbqP